VSDLEGQTFEKVINTGYEIQFINEQGNSFVLYHEQDCCEDVYVDDVVGDLDDLVGMPILGAEEVSYDGGAKEKYDESYTWTFYKFKTEKGYVDIKFYGTSNGYYSESVDIARLI
jgi:hypothetical protein